MTKITSIQRAYAAIMKNLVLLKSQAAKLQNPLLLRNLAASKGSSPPGGSSKAALWRNLSFLVAFPAIGIVAAYVIYDIKNQPEHERPPFVKYEYLRIRNRRFAWGDGTKSLFHNPHVNPLPDGYEEENEE